MYIKKKTFILIITYLSAAAIAFGAYSAVLSVGGAGYRNTARYGYEHAFGEVVTAAEKLSDALHRALTQPAQRCRPRSAPMSTAAA